ncbi:MAG: zinc metallopeptidase [Gammaproteobacteria bacterium]
MAWFVPVLLLMVILTGPGLWVARVLKRYEQPADRYRASGTGASLARHLLDGLGLCDVNVEPTAQGDHYDPRARAVRLSPRVHDGTSLTAITVAAHEVGHAIQHARGEPWFQARDRLARVAIGADRAARLLLVAAPVLMAITRVPLTGLLCVLTAVGAVALGALVHLVTLPVEFDASFGKALPLLERGRLLHPPDLPHARRILRAAALTYVAASLGGLLNLARWMSVLRR